MTAEEFAWAKVKLLDNTALQRRLQEIEHQNALIQLDQEWEQERESFMVKGRYGARTLPDRSAPILIFVLGIFLSGLLLVPLAIKGPGAAALAILGVLNFVICMWCSFQSMQKVDKYEAAYSHYQERRAQLLNQQGRSASP